MTANPRFKWINWNIRVVRNSTASYDGDSVESGDENGSEADSEVSYDTPPVAVRSASPVRTRRVCPESALGARAAAHNAAERADAGDGDDRQLLTDGGRTAKANIDDPDLLAALEDAEQEHGSMAEALRHAVRATYADSDDEVGSTIGPDLPADLRDGYTALVDRYGTDSRIGLESAKSAIAQATQTPKEDTIRSVIEPLRQRGYLGVHTGRQHVGVIIPERTATDGGSAEFTERARDLAADVDDEDIEERDDVEEQFERLESAEIDRGDGIETDGGRTPDESLLEVITDHDPAEMDHRELYREWHEAAEGARKTADADVQQQLHDRRGDLWSEMESRVDAEPPECPECGGASWSQTLGEPKQCDQCGLVLGFGHEDLIDRVDAYWDAVRAPGVRPSEGGESR